MSRLSSTGASPFGTLARERKMLGTRREQQSWRSTGVARGSSVSWTSRLSIPRRRRPHALRPAQGPGLMKRRGMLRWRCPLCHARLDTRLTARGGSRHVVERFENDDQGSYLCWAEAHPFGYIVNLAKREFKPRHPVVHSVRHALWTSQRETHTRSDYIKVCAGSLEELESWAQLRYRRPLAHCRFMLQAHPFCTPKPAVGVSDTLNPSSSAIQLRWMPLIEGSTLMRRSHICRLCPGPVPLSL